METVKPISIPIIADPVLRHSNQKEYKSKEPAYFWCSILFSKSIRICIRTGWKGNGKRHIIIVMPERIFNQHTERILGPAKSTIWRTCRFGSSHTIYWWICKKVSERIKWLGNQTSTLCQAIIYSPCSIASKQS